VNAAKEVYYFERCEALGILERAINTLSIQPIDTPLRVRTRDTLHICQSMIQAELVYYAATHKEEYDQSR